MRYKSLSDCVKDLETHKFLVRIDDLVDPYLEAAEIHRRICAKGGPALLFTNLRGSKFPAVSNLFGTDERCSFIFRKTMKTVQQAIAIKAAPKEALRRPWKFLRAPFAAITSLPKKVSSGPVFDNEASIADLPPITSWPLDGGPFITLPQVYTEDPERPGWSDANIGMYRIQLSGNEYALNSQIGLHYQIHRGIGIHHTKALQRGEKLRVSIFVGGPPAHTVAAVMPLPEGLSEAIFAGMLAGRRMRLAEYQGYRVAVDSDFCIIGTVETSATLPEGPFGDHLGYYSLKHPFPFLKVEKVFHRHNAIWSFTVVGRPPQEDTSFGNLIHKITKPMVPVTLPGVKALHAVDVTGVHPLLLAIGSERYVPYEARKPQELLTIANSILGFNQCSLAKYLLITAHEDDAHLDIHHVKKFLMHVLSRVDLTRDLHFQTQTTIDTLDYSGTAMNEGSKLVIAACGEIKRSLGEYAPSIALPSQYSQPKLIIPGVLYLQTPQFSTYDQAQTAMADLCRHLEDQDLTRFPLIVLVDKIEEIDNNFDNFLWVCFTRSNPSHDVYGVGSFQRFKHWGCRGPMIIDARIKPHHAPILTSDALISKRAESVISNHSDLKNFLEKN